MSDHESSSPFVRMQPGRSMIRPQAAARKHVAPPSPADRTASRTVGEPAEVTHSPQSSPSKRPSHAPFEALKQWELVEDDKGLQVVEKRAGGLLSSVRPAKQLSVPVASAIYGRTSVASRKFFSQPPPSVESGANLEERLRGFNESKTVQPVTIRYPLGQSREQPPKAPLSLDLILKQQQQQQQQQQQRSTAIESIDMLQRLEQQVKAIEMGTIAARTTHRLENSADFGPEVQLRYREHEDLLRNVTDDEADG